MRGLRDENSRTLTSLTVNYMFLSQLIKFAELEKQQVQCLDLRVPG